jgi:hypothetical protein
MPSGIAVLAPFGRTRIPMSLRGWKNWCSALRRRVIVGLVLMSHLASIFGLPLPASAFKAGGEPYGCQDSPCGCQSAEQFWKGCCCMSPEQRWAWAREHQVEPPSYAERPGNSFSKSSCCKPRVAIASSSCCSKKAATPTEPSTSPDVHMSEKSPKDRGLGSHPIQSQAGLRWSLGLAAQRCQGQSSHWTSAGAAIPPAPPVHWSPGTTAVGWLEPEISCLDDWPTSPPEPPPRPDNA